MHWRSAIPALSLDDAFSRKDDVAFDVQKTVGNEMSRFGFTVVKTLITAIDPSPQVKNAMVPSTLPSARREATRQRAEAQRIQIETQAAAEAEKTVFRVKARLTIVVRSPMVSSTRSRVCRQSA